MLFLINQEDEKSKRTRRYLPDTTVSLKKGDFNTPPVFLFFKKKTAVKFKYNKRANNTGLVVCVIGSASTRLALLLF